jgi:hypothetical protein
MKYIVCFSGGHSSALVAIEAVRTHGKENVILLNHDISSRVEHKDVKRFKQDIADYLDLPITYANAQNFEQRTPLAVIRELGILHDRFGNALCTYELKTKPFIKWLKENYPVSVKSPCDAIRILYGFDVNEKHRIQRRCGIMSTKGYRCEFPLFHGYNRTIESTLDIGIKIPITYKTMRHANCKGCLKAGQQHWYFVYCTDRDLFYEAAETELIADRSIIKGYYLADLEDRFKKFRESGVTPHDTGDNKYFWREVRAKLPPEPDMPCECCDNGICWTQETLF